MLRIKGLFLSLIILLVSESVFANLSVYNCEQAFRSAISHDFEKAFYSKFPFRDYGMQARAVKIHKLDQYATKIKAGEYHEFKVAHPREDFGTVWLANKNQTMRFDIELGDNAQGLKLYAYLLKSALQKFPKTQSLPSIMPTDLSLNARIFFKHLENKKLLNSIKNYRFLKYKKSTLIKLREEAVNALLKMPSTKARFRNGFGDIKSIFINTTDDNKLWVSFDIQRGHTESIDDIAIFIKNNDTDNYYQVSAKGKVIGKKRFNDEFPKDYLKNSQMESDLYFVHYR